MNRFAAVRRSITALAVAGCGAAFGQGWNQVWADEFSTGTVPDPTKWTYELGANGWGNNELQNYTNRSENARVETTDGGRLRIEARRDFYQGKEYSSARMQNSVSWLYGKIEVRAKLPSGRGTWPAIWMLPKATTYGTGYWPDNGEIDIMEHVGYDPNVVHGTVHTKLYNGMIGNPPSNQVTLADVFNTYHVYTCEWRPHEIRILCDNNPVLVWARQGGDWQRWPFNKPFNMRFNVAVGGNWGGAQGVDSSVFPTSMYVDYIRYSQLTTTPFKTTAPTLPGRIQAEDFDNGGSGYGYWDSDTANQGGGTYRTSQVDIGPNGTDDGTPTIGWIANDEWLTYTFKAKTALKGALLFRVASVGSGKKFEVQIDDKIVASNVSVPDTADWNKYRTVTVPNLSITAGTHKLRVLSSADGWNFNWFEFRQLANVENDIPKK